jgi:LuxR family maltose regulon positive regulatory protein
LEHALVLAQPEGFVRIFVDEGDPIRSLLLDFRKAGIKQPRRGNLDLISYVDQLLSTFSLPRIMQSSKWYESEARPAINKLAVSEPLIEPLSQRELEILRLLQTELSVPEIAGELVIAVSTVRTHTKSIFSKLNVNNRRAAVKRAAELNLI